jgi:single-strand DNA-binding protein
MNKALLIGNLGNDPEVKYTPNGTAVAVFNLATSHKYRDKSEKLVEVTTWHRCVSYGKLAENVGQFLKKGRQVHIEGRIDNRSFESGGVKKYISEVIAEKVEFLGGARSDAPARVPDNEFSRQTGGHPNDAPITDDDIPF